MGKKARLPISTLEQKAERVVDALQEVVIQKITNGLGEVESRILPPLVNKLIGLESQCRETQENFHELGVRIVKIEANGVRLGMVISVPGKCN